MISRLQTRLYQLVNSISLKIKFLTKLSSELCSEEKEVLLESATLVNNKMEEYESLIHYSLEKITGSSIKSST